MNSELNPKTLAKIKDDTLKRCHLMPWNEETEKKFCPISPEQIHFLFEASSVAYPLFLRIEDILIEYVRPEEFSKSLLQNLIAALTKKVDLVKVCVKVEDKDRLLAQQNVLRKDKINKLFANYPRLDPRILKVFDQISFASQMIIEGGIDSDVVEKVKTSTAAAVDQLLDNPNAIVTLSEMIRHDATLYDHSATVAMLAVSVASEYNKHRFSRADFTLLAMCGLYHDVGKTCIPSHILNKPGTFTESEYEVMKEHAELGEAHLNSLVKKGYEIHDLVCRVAGEHHEKFDGSGYPKGIAGRLEEQAGGIHLYTRVVTIADVYSALLMERVYKPAFKPQESLEIMLNLSAHYDPLIFKSFVNQVVTGLKDYHNPGKEKGRIFVKEDGKAPEEYSKVKKSS